MMKIDMIKVRGLAEASSPILLRGFPEMKDLDLFKQTAREMGSILPWQFGEVLVVKDVGDQRSGDFGIVQSAEPIPFHFDGVYKTKTVVTDDGKKKLVSQPPR